jgi:Flp pilus assembly pilin Flp
MLNRIQLFLGKAFIAEGLKREEGQTATEYAVVIGVIVIGVGGAAIVLKGQLVSFIESVGGGLAGLLGA